MNVYEIITELPKISELLESISKCREYLEQHSHEPNNPVYQNVQAAMTAGKAAVKLGFSQMGVDELSKILEMPDKKTHGQWQSILYKHVETKLVNCFLKQILNNTHILHQISPETVQKFKDFLDAFPMENTEKGIIELCLSECCRTSDPQQSFDMSINAFRHAPAMLAGNEGHLKGYEYKDTFWDNQVEFTQCPICGGQGIPYHNAPAWKMENFINYHLPSKLWMQCPKCKNLYTRYFAREYLECKADDMVIMPETNIECAVSNVNVDELRSWCDILQSIRQFTDGNGLLEVGIGRGGMIAAALEMGYTVDCVEIVKEEAQKMANLLQIPILCCDFLELPERKQYDAISMGDVIEHMRSPKLGLEKAYRLLKESGVAWISTPNFESAYNRLHGMQTAMWCESQHVTYFNRTGLEKLLQEVGFTILDYRIGAHYNGSMEFLVSK